MNLLVNDHHTQNFDVSNVVCHWYLSMTDNETFWHNSTFQLICSLWQFYHPTCFPQQLLMKNKVDAGFQRLRLFYIHANFTLNFSFFFCIIQFESMSRDICCLVNGLLESSKTCWSWFFFWGKMTEIFWEKIFDVGWVQQWCSWKFEKVFGVFQEVSWPQFYQSTWQNFWMSQRLQSFEIWRN